MKKTLLLLGLLGGFAVSATPVNICNNLNNLSTVSEKTNIKKATTTIRNGYILNFKFTDDYGETLPLKDLYVEVHQIIGQYEWTIERGYTSEDGRYEFVNLDSTYESGNSGMFYFKVFSKGHGYSVTDQSGNVYTWESEPYTYLHYATYRTDQIFSIDEELGRRFALTQAVRIGAEYAKFMNGGKYVTNCTVHYPTTASTSYYNNYDHIYLENEMVDTNLRSTFYPCMYSNFDTVLHEFGHHVGKVFKISDSPGGTHHQWDNSEDEYFRNYGYEEDYGDISRDRGLRLAYGEGWATAFSVLAQRHFRNEFPKHPFYGDNSYNSPGLIQMNFDSRESQKGEGSDYCITSLIWNIFDEFDENDPTDTVCEDESILLALAQNTKTISEFVSRYIARTNNREGLRVLLSELGFSSTYVIAPKKLYRNVSPMFEWDCGGGTKYFPNNKFYFHIKSELQDHIAKYDTYITVPRGTQKVTYTVPDYQWKQIITTGADYFTIYIESFCDQYGIRTGSYESQTFTFRVPTEKKMNIDIVSMDSLDWGFAQAYNWTEISTSVQKDGYYFNTRRFRTGCIERDQIVLSAKKKNAGNAYFEITTDYMIDDAEFDVALWSNSEGIKPNNSTITVELLDANGNWNVDYDLWNDVTLPTDKDSTIRLRTISSGFYGIRWRVTAPATGSHNNGRLVLKDISFNI